MNGFPPSFAFAISEDDVQIVLERNMVKKSERQIAKITGSLDHNKIAMVACKASTDMDEQTDAAHDEIERQLLDDGHIPSVTCCICHQRCNAKTAHIHQDEWIGDECCWDERLRGSE